jgi:hypothetical protein
MTAGAVEVLLQPSENPLPDDLRSWIDRHALVRLVLAAIQTANLPVAPATPTRDGGAGFRPHILLGVLTYCYATGVYASSDIELEFNRDTVVRHLFADVYPEADRLRSFRRRNRTAIQRCLAEVLRRVCRVRAGLESESLDESADAPAASPDFPTTGKGMHPFADEADERINRAVRLDCWALDV